MKRTQGLDAYKAQAARLREYLAQGGHQIKQTHALEAVARMHGFANYQILKASEAGEQIATATLAERVYLKAVLAEAIGRATRECAVAEGATALAMELQVHMDGELDAEPGEERFPLMLDETAMRACQLTLDPYYVPALLAAVHTCYGQFNQELIDACVLVTQQCDLVEALAANHGGDVAARFEEAYQLKQVRACAFYTMALCGCEMKDYRRIAATIAMVDMPELYDPTLEVAAWLLGGEYGRAYAAFYRARLHRHEFFSWMGIILEALSALDNGGNAIAEVTPNESELAVLSRVQQASARNADVNTYREEALRFARFAEVDEGDLPSFAPMDRLVCDLESAVDSVYVSNEAFKQWVTEMLGSVRPKH